jgi:hypothetical protein
MYYSVLIIIDVLKHPYQEIPIFNTLINAVPFELKKPFDMTHACFLTRHHYFIRKRDPRDEERRNPTKNPHLNKYRKKIPDAFQPILYLRFPSPEDQETLRKDGRMR